MTWLPPPLIGLAFACAAFMPVLLIALRWAPPVLRRPGPRIKASIGIAWAGWFGASVLGVSADCVAPMIDWLAGGAIMLAATLTVHVVWSLLVWGFTVNLLTTLVRLACPVDRVAWGDAYSGGRSDLQICRDRVAVLIALGVANGQNDQYRLDRFRSRAILIGYKAARRLFGMQT